MYRWGSGCGRCQRSWYPDHGTKRGAGCSVPAGERRRGKAGIPSMHFPPTRAWCPWGGIWGRAVRLPHSLDPTALGSLSIMAVGTGEPRHALDHCALQAWGQRTGRIHAETSLGLLTLPAVSICCCIWAILDRSWINFTKILLTCCLTCTKIKPKGGIGLVIFSLGALRALMGFNWPK